MIQVVIYMAVLEHDSHLTTLFAAVARYRVFCHLVVADELLHVYYNHDIWMLGVSAAYLLLIPT